MRKNKQKKENNAGYAILFTVIIVSAISVITAGISNAVYKQIVLALQDTFKISETEAIGLSSMSDTDFTNYYYRIEEYGKAVQ